jgi:hypothetical protein
MTERSISQEDVEVTIRNPRETVLVKYGRLAALSPLRRGRHLVVVYEQEDQDFILITAVKVNKRGAGKYGFTRI